MKDTGLPLLEWQFKFHWRNPSPTLQSSPPCMSSVSSISAEVCWSFWAQISQLLNFDSFTLWTTAMFFLGKYSNNIMANSVVMRLGSLENTMRFQDIWQTCSGREEYIKIQFLKLFLFWAFCLSPFMEVANFIVVALHEKQLHHYNFQPS